MGQRFPEGFFNRGTSGKKLVDLKKFHDLPYRMLQPAQTQPTFSLKPVINANQASQSTAAFFIAEVLTPFDS